MWANKAHYFMKYTRLRLCLHFPYAVSPLLHYNAAAETLFQ